MITIKSAADIEGLKESCRIVVEAINLAESLIAPGLKTGELDRIIAEFIQKAGGRPAFKGFYGYPANICTSIDEEVVHGIPGDRALQEGQIVSVDVGVEKNGWYGDAAKTFAVGAISAEKQRLMQVTREALYRGIAKAVEGNRLSDIGHAVQPHVEKAGFSVVRDLVGHGIGRSMHEAPQIPNYGEPHRGPRLKEGMVFAIEPMVNAGGYEVRTRTDQWTVVAEDGSCSAHFEHDVVVTRNGAIILTEGI